MRAWRPILSPSSEIAARSWAAVHAIAESVLNHDYPPEGPRRHRAHEEALLYAYLAVAGEEDVWLARAEQRLNQAISTAGRQRNHIGLFGGLCGLGWVVEHLAKGLNTESPDQAPEEDLNREIDEVVLGALRAGPWKGPYDLISGLAGFGVYFLERYPAGLSAEGIARVISLLDELSTPTKDGVTWHTPPELLPNWQRQLCPAGYYNLGVAHGIPGILYFLGHAAAAGLAGQRGALLLDGGIDWLIANQRPPGSRSSFSGWLSSSPSTDSRFTWCYGDPGILAVLLQVAQQSRKESHRQFAQVLMERCLDWPLEHAGIADAPLCHGAMGAAHIFNRIHQQNDDARCLEMALKWIDRALEFRRPGEGVGGFSALTRPDPERDFVWEPSPAFLDGGIGVALGLLAALTPLEPAWDRMLLLSGKTLWTQNQ